MSVIYIVLPIALLLAVLGLTAFIWAVRKGQFDDLDSPSIRMLFDDEEGVEGSNHEGTNGTKEGGDAHRRER